MKRKRFGTRSTLLIANKLISLITLVFFSASTVFALPDGPQTVNGQASFNTQGNSLNITNTPNTIINWQGFSIASNEAVRFIQQSSSSAVLNRVIGQDPSRILGLLQSNGRVFLINPNGILFGQGSQIDVNGLVASTLNISNQDFLAGKYNFTAGSTAGSVQNQGTITTPAGGKVYLVAPDVENSGIINSPGGEILLAAGNSVQLVDSIDPDISVVISAPENKAVNLGQIIAQSGKVGIYGGLIYQKGLVNADSAVAGENGRIFLKASGEVTLDAGSTTRANGPQGGQIEIESETATTLVSGTVTAAGNDGKGGDIKVLGSQVSLVDNAQIDASGKGGGGTVLIGGDFHGKNPAVRNAEATYAGKDAVIRADATETGDGGKVVLWADNRTGFYGFISARGGAAGGDGGNAEVSGRESLIYQGLADLRAPFGKTGTLLLDPTNFFIQPVGGNITGAALGAQLDLADVTVQTDPVGAQNGDLYVDDSVTWTSANSLDLNAHNDILMNNVINNNSGGTLVLRADSDGNGGGNVYFAGIGHVNLSGGGGAAILYNPPAGYSTPTDYSGYFTGVTPVSYMLVNNVNDLQNIANNLAGTYALGRNIDASATVGWNSGAGFDPLGSASAIDAFSGVFEGLGYTISDLYINRPTTDYVGIFSGDSHPTIRNVGIINVNVTGQWQVGGLIAHVGVDGNIFNSYVSGGTVTATGGSSVVGGLTGLNAGTITRCYSTASVNGTGSYVGGLVGSNYSTGTAPVYNAVITDSFSTGAVSGGSLVGGLVGGIYRTTGVNSVINSYSTGSVTGSGGGLIGSITGSSTVFGCYWDTQTSGRATSIAGTGKTTPEMKQQATFAGWDFVNTWGITENVTYPFLVMSSAPPPPPPPPPLPTTPSTTETEGVIGNSVATSETIVALETTTVIASATISDGASSGDQEDEESEESPKKDKERGEGKTYEKFQGDKVKNFCN